MFQQNNAFRSDKKRLKLKHGFVGILNNFSPKYTTARFKGISL